jgi:2-iminobutanoate/2-iminopropanoate deaminase
MIEVIPTTGVLQYEPLGFTNCVRYRDVLYLSGITAVNARGEVGGEDIETQTAKTFETIETVLKAAGSGLEKILQMTSFVVDIEHNGRRYVDARKRLLPQPTYTSATIGVSALMMPGLLLEVQCCAAVP